MKGLGDGLGGSFLDEDLSIDLTPLIDVIFMLLVFFIMTTTFSKPVMEIILPEAQNVEDSEKEEEVLISITSEGAYFYQDEELTLSDIMDLLDENPESTINFYVDKDAHFEAFIMAIDKVKEREGRFVISTEVQ